MSARAATSRRDAADRGRGPSLVSTSRLGLAALLAVTLLAAALPAAAAGAGSTDDAPVVSAPLPRERGDFIFFPMTVFSDPAVKAQYFDYLRRFRVCLTNGYAVFARDELAQLRGDGDGCEVFLYRWFNGYYVEELEGTGYYGEFPEVVAVFQEIHRHPEWLLNPDHPTQGNGAVKPAYFYDWSHPGLRAFYVDALVERLDATTYDGVFFDYIGDWALPEQIKALWDHKHPDLSYNEAGLLLVSELRAALGERRIFGNQAYRLDNARAYYTHIDYDVTESYGVSSMWGKEAVIYVEDEGWTKVTETFYRPWDGLGGYEQYIAAPRSATSGAPVEFFQINYLQDRYVPTGATLAGGLVPVYRRVVDRPALYYGYALSMLDEHASFASDWYATTPGRDDVYFADLGEALEADYRELEDAVVRYFENGFVVVTRTNSHNNQLVPAPVPTGSGTTVSVDVDPAMVPADAEGLWDAFAQDDVASWSPTAGTVDITPTFYPATGSYYPSGRVYLYVRPTGSSASA